MAGVGADMNGVPHELGAETQTQGRIVVAGGQDHRGEFGEFVERAVEQRDRRGGRNAAIVDIPGDQDGIDIVFAYHLDDMRTPHLKGRGEIGSMQASPQMPVGCVKDSHGSTLAALSDTFSRPRLPLPPDRHICEDGPPHIGVGRPV